MADVLTNAGEAFIIDELDAFGTYYLAWGTGAGTAAKGDTTLFTEASETRVSTTDSQPAADTIQWLATLTADGSKTITNAGIFDAATVGTLIVKGDHTGVAVVLSDQIEYTVTLQIT